MSIPPAPIRAFEGPQDRADAVRQLVVGVASSVIAFYILYRLKVFK